MNHYETIVIFHPDLSDENLEQQIETVRSRLTAGEAEIAACEDWGKRRLAYTIRRQRYGSYVMFRYGAQPAVSREVERLLGINERALKFMTVRCRPDAETPQDLLKGEGRRSEEEEGAGSGASAGASPRPRAGSGRPAAGAEGPKEEKRGGHEESGEKREASEERRAEVS